MARNLANSLEKHPAGSLPLLVYNRTTSKSEKLLKELGPSKIRIVDNPSDLATECNIIFTNLVNDEVVKSAYKGFHEILKESPPTKTKTFVETSTIYPAVAGELDILISEIPHARLVTCPVFGSPQVANKAQLLCVMSGDYRAKKEVAYFLVPGVVRKVMDLGGNIEKAPTFKLIGNSFILGALEVMAEGLTLAEKSGIGSDLGFELLKEILPAPMVTMYGEKMINDRFNGAEGFAIDGGIKDASHIRRLTGDLNSPMPVIDLVHQHMLTARAGHVAQTLLGKAQYKVLDWSALVAGVRIAAGLDGLDSNKHSKVVEEVDD